MIVFLFYPGSWARQATRAFSRKMFSIEWIVDLLAVFKCISLYNI